MYKKNVYFFLLIYMSQNYKLWKLEFLYLKKYIYIM